MFASKIVCCYHHKLDKICVVITFDVRCRDVCQLVALYANLYVKRMTFAEVLSKSTSVFIEWQTQRFQEIKLCFLVFPCIYHEEYDGLWHCANHV